MTTTDLVPASQAQQNLAGQQNLGADEEQYLTFLLADETYGIDILKVQEIRGWSDPTPIPNAPNFIRGVTNLRGEIVPILDVRRRFNMDETEFTKYTVVIVVNVQDRTIGMVVDGVSDVVNLPMEDKRPAPDFGTSIDANFISSLATQDDKMIILLNIDAMLQGSELLAVDALAESADAPAENAPEAKDE